MQLAEDQQDRAVEDEEGPDTDQAEAGGEGGRGRAVVGSGSQRGGASARTTTRM
jgi:hypothetical protein